MFGVVLLDFLSLLVHCISIFEDALFSKITLICTMEIAQYVWTMLCIGHYVQTMFYNWLFNFAIIYSFSAIRLKEYDLTNFFKNILVGGSVPFTHCVFFLKKILHNFGPVLQIEYLLAVCCLLYTNENTAFQFN